MDRYWFSEVFGNLEKHKAGEWVKHSDVKALEKENKRLRDKILEIYENRPDCEWFQLCTWIQDNMEVE